MEDSVQGSVARPSGNFPVFVVGALAGMIGMFFFDPRGGNRRRAYVRDKIVHSNRLALQFIDKRSRDLRNRIYGAGIETSRLFRWKEAVDDAILVERIRSKMGRAASHPKLVSIDAKEGHVLLTGIALKSELPRIYEAVRSVRGVRVIHNQVQGVQSERDISRYSGIRGNQMANQPRHASAPTGGIGPSI